jgi:hypothetical protein
MGSIELKSPMSINILVLKLFATKVTKNNETNPILTILFDAISLKTYPEKHMFCADR